MTLRRLAQVFAWLSLGCLTALVWSAAGLYSMLRNPGMWLNAALLAGLLLNFLDKAGYTLAVVAAVLLLVWVAQRRQRARFISLLVATILLPFTYATGWHDLLAATFLFPLGVPGPQPEAVVIALHIAPSALLALLVVAWSVAGGLAARRISADIPADSSLEIQVESLHADAAE